MLSGRGAVELWSGHLDEAARVLDSGVAAAVVSGNEYEQADCLGQLALVEALRGGLRRAATLAAQASARAPTGSGRPASSRTPRRPSHWPGCTWSAMSCARRAAASSRRTPPSASARTSWSVPWPAWSRASSAWPKGAPSVAAQMVAGARRGWPVPPWLEQRLTLVESQACTAAGDIRAAFAAAERVRRRLRAGGGGCAGARVGGGRRPQQRQARAGPRAGRPRRGCPNGCACRRGWLTPGSATTAVTAHAVAGHLSPRCGWPSESSSGCRSPCSAAGSAACCGVTLNWPARTGSCSSPA